MYSPKIKSDLIPILYRLSKEKEKPMTRIVDDLLRPELVRYEEQKEIPHCVSCYSRLEISSRSVTAFCKLCRSETFVLYSVPLNDFKGKVDRKEVI